MSSAGLEFWVETWWCIKFSCGEKNPDFWLETGNKQALPHELCSFVTTLTSPHFSSRHKYCGALSSEGKHTSLKWGTCTNHEAPMHHVLHVQWCHTRGPGTTTIWVYPIIYSYTPTGPETHNSNLCSHVLNRSAILCPWSQLLLPSSPQSAVCSLQCEPGCLPWPVLSTKKQAAHYLAAHPHGEIPITGTFSMQRASRGSLNFLRFVRVFLIIMFSRSLGLMPSPSLLNVSRLWKERFHNRLFYRRHCREDVQGCRIP